MQVWSREKFMNFILQLPLITVKHVATVVITSYIGTLVMWRLYGMYTHTYVTARTASSTGHLYCAPLLPPCACPIPSPSSNKYVLLWDHTWVMPTDGEGEDSHWDLGQKSCNLCICYLAHACPNNCLVYSAVYSQFNKAMKLKTATFRKLMFCTLNFQSPMTGWTVPFILKYNYVLTQTLLTLSLRVRHK